MLIMLGGYLGSGRPLLARYLADVTGFYRYPLKDKKTHLMKSKNGRVLDRMLEPRTDGERSLIYKQVISELPVLSKMYNDVIIDDPFHRAEPRDLFISEAKKFFDKVVFVWVESPDELIDAKLEIMKARGMFDDVEAVRRQHEKITREFQSFAERPLIFFHKISDRNAAERLIGYITHCVKRGFV